MGQKSNFDRLPKEYRVMVIKLLSEKRLTEEAIVKMVNDKAGKLVITKSSLNRFSQRLREEQAEKKAASSTKSLERIGAALERIADSLERLPEKQG
jgi:RNA polymerase-binding transcription factor DksA